MSSPDERHLRVALIPWIIALVALFGWQSLAPDHSQVRKAPRTDGVGLSQVADDDGAPGTLPNRLVPLALAPPSGIVLPEVVTSELGIEELHELPVVPWRGLSIQGRAPPSAWRC